MTDLAVPDEFVLPAYDGGSVANAPATIAALFGAELAGLPPLAPPLWRTLGDDVRRVVALIVDGWGWNLLEKERPFLQPFLDSAHTVGRITSIFPSTTVAALSSLWTGAAPAQHGLVGLSLFFPEYGTIGQMLRLSPDVVPYADGLVQAGLDPAAFLAWPPLAEGLAQNGVPTHRFQTSDIINSALSQMHGRGVARDHGVLTLADMLLQMRRLLESSAGERLYVAAYWPTIDSLSHVHGWNDEIVAAELQTIVTQIQAQFLQKLSRRARRKTVFLLLADHGQALTPAAKALYLEDHPRLQDMLLMKPTGEPRVPYLYTRHGQLQAALEYLNAELGHALVAWPSAQVLSQGLLGPPPFAPRSNERIGDVVVVMRDGYALLNTRVADEQRALRWNGRHGGLTRAEMLVPWLAFRLDER